MTKSEIRRARKAAHAAGQPLTGELAIGLDREVASNLKAQNYAREVSRANRASRAEQRGRYIDCGPQNWDDQ